MKRVLTLLFLMGALCACEKEKETPPIAGEPVNLGRPMKLTPSDPATIVPPAPK